MYQLWLDDLYPRAKFADGLAMIEKLGHTKRLQVMRREWINEGKSKDYPETSESKSSPDDVVRPDLSSSGPVASEGKSGAAMHSPDMFHIDAQERRSCIYKK